MPFFATPFLLIWRDSAWHSVPAQDYLDQHSDVITDSTAQKLSMDEGLKQLESYLRHNKKPFAVLLPDAWIEVGDVNIEPGVPQSLYLLAAHTRSDQISLRSSREQVISYYVDHDASPMKMHIALLAQGYYAALTQLGVKQVFSEGLVRSAKLRKVRQLGCDLGPFVTYRDDYLERQKDYRTRMVLAGLICLVGIATASVSLSIIDDTPNDIADFRWPWPTLEQTDKEIVTSFGYLRTLPSTLRLDEVDANEQRIYLRVTGKASDLAVWQANWPANLPALEVTLNEEAPL